MPLFIYVDTVTNRYYVQLKGLAKASIEEHEEELLMIKLKVFFLKFQFYPLRKIEPKKDKKTTSVSKKKSKKRISFHKIVRVIKSFRVQKLTLDLDTGDNVVNAKLYPLFTFLNFTKGNFAINFEGRNEFSLIIKNRPIYLIKSFINF